MDWAPGQFERFDLTDTITISAGTDGPRLTVHTNVVTTSTSPFLKAALSNGWKEAREKNIVLQETETSALEGYVHWLYTNCIIETKEEDDPFHFRELFELYLLGDFLKDTRFCQNVMAAIIRRGKDGVYLPMSSEMFAMSGRDLPSSLSLAIRELWLAAPVGCTIDMFRSATDPQYPMDFVLDLVHELSERRRDVKMSSYSGKAHYQVESACMSFVTDAMAVDKEK